MVRCLDDGVLVGDPVDLALRLWAAAHGVAALLVAKPHFPWPPDVDAFIDRTVVMAGFGLVLEGHLDAQGLELPQLLQALGTVGRPG